MIINPNRGETPTNERMQYPYTNFMDSKRTLKGIYQQEAQRAYQHARAMLNQKIKDLNAMSFEATENNNTIGVFAVADKDGRGPEMVVFLGFDDQSKTHILGGVLRGQPDGPKYFINKGTVVKERPGTITDTRLISVEQQTTKGLGHRYDELMADSDTWSFDTTKGKFVNAISADDSTDVSAILAYLAGRVIDAPEGIRNALTELNQTLPTKEDNSTVIFHV